MQAAHATRHDSAERLPPMQPRVNFPVPSSQARLSGPVFQRRSFGPLHLQNLEVLYRQYGRDGNKHGLDWQEVRTPHCPALPPPSTPS